MLYLIGTYLVYVYELQLIQVQNRKIQTAGAAVSLSKQTFIRNCDFRNKSNYFVLNFVSRSICETYKVIDSRFETNINKAWEDNSCTDFVLKMFLEQISRRLHIQYQRNNKNMSMRRSIETELLVNLWVGFHGLSSVNFHQFLIQFV